jgi:hypothetical protein
LNDADRQHGKRRRSPQPLAFAQPNGIVGRSMTLDADVKDKSDISGFSNDQLADADP